jgi:hypothetical protein
LDRRRLFRVTRENSAVGNIRRRGYRRFACGLTGRECHATGAAGVIEGVGIHRRTDEWPDEN